MTIDVIQVISQGFSTVKLLLLILILRTASVSGYELDSGDSRKKWGTQFLSSLCIPVERKIICFTGEKTEPQWERDLSKDIIISCEQDSDLTSSQTSVTTTSTLNQCLSQPTCSLLTLSCLDASGEMTAQVAPYLTASRLEPVYSPELSEVSLSDSGAHVSCPVPGRWLHYLMLPWGDNTNEMAGFISYLIVKCWRR